MHAFCWYVLLVNDPSGKAGKPWPPPDQRIRPTQATTQRKNRTPRKPLRETPAKVPGQQASNTAGRRNEADVQIVRRRQFEFEASR